MNDSAAPHGLDRATAIIGLVLIGLAGVLVYDARSMNVIGGYGIGPTAMTYAVAAGLALLGLAHLVASRRAKAAEREPADWGGVAWIIGGLVAVIVLLKIDGGFIPGMAILFAATARGFGRTAILTDLLIGVVVGCVVYLAFTKLLTLSLPQGPLERLLF